MHDCIKRFIRSVTLVVCAFAVIGSDAGTAYGAALIDPALQGFARGVSGSPSYTYVIVAIDPSVEGLPLPRRYQYREVVYYLRATASRGLNRIAHYLQSQGVLDQHVRIERSHWITSTMRVVTTRDGLRSLANAPGVTKIYADHPIYLENDVTESSDIISSLQHSRSENASIPYDIIDTQLDRVHAQYPHINGQGVALGQIDTGVEGTHPALAGRIHSYFDARKKQLTTPVDTGDHGTHTAGTMVGLPRDGVPLGMAPGAVLIAAGPLSGYSDMLTAMEFMLDPDQNPNTADVPRAINNSWNAGGAPDMELFYRAISAWEAAGILPVFSAGNRGPYPRTITNPKEHPATFSVAATGQNGKITSFSSRGPATFQGQTVQKPEISAPGEAILSSVPDGRFRTMSGTSMAAPHVAGAVALLVQADPMLTPQQLRSILIQTATPMNEEGDLGRGGEWNPIYGFGKLNIHAAVEMALQSANARRGGGNSFFSMIEGLFTTPNDMAVEALLATDDGRVQDVLEFPSSFEGNAWLRADQVWTN